MSRPLPDAVSAVHEQNVYRPDIDGLRAVAVLSVVLFHAGVAGLPGGFIGVDVFFVISGYLIGGQIFRQARHGSFTYTAFYARRVRRILPALYALLAVMFAAGAILLTPLELRELGKEAVATILAASNILFYQGGGYFAPAAALDPLLMTWSLGVEEQFYIFFPIIVFLLLRLKWPPLAALTVLSIISFVGSLVLTRIDQQAAFYLLPTRAWELGAGAVLALWEQENPQRDLKGRAGEFCGAAALLVLAAAILFYRSSIAFPGPFALVPVAAATVLIATRSAMVNRVLLANPAAVFIGKISYSLYLWHWPLIYFDRVLTGGSAGPVALVLGSFAMAVLSWKFVEQPFRRRKLGTVTILWAYAGVALALTLLPLGFYVSQGWPHRLPATAQAFAQSSRQSRESPCLAPYGASSPQNLPLCLPGAVKDRLVVIGDSHASAIAPGFRRLAAQGGLGFGEMTKSSCPPLWHAAPMLPDRPRHFAECTQFQEHAFAYIAGHPEIGIVVLAGYWSNDMVLTDPDGAKPVALPQALARTVSRLRGMGRRVVLVQDVPTFAFDPYARVIGGMMPARRALSGEGGDLTATHDVITDTARPVIAASAPAATLVIDPWKSLCDAAGCHYRGPDDLYYSDPQHLTAAGAIQALATIRGLPR